MQKLLNFCKKAEIQLDEGHQELAELIQTPGGTLNGELKDAIKMLWTSDSGVQQAYERRAEFQLNDSASYFFDVIDRCAASDYKPVDQDILRARVKTTGIVEAEFDVEGYHFRVFDVGGQRAERRKWIHCFENVTAVIFIIGASEYDQVLYEDETQNRMTEALDLFNEICNSRWFENTSFILFLNKKDLLKQKLDKGVDLRRCFPDYSGGSDYTKAIARIKEEFLKLNENPKRKQVYPHETCATDTENVKFVFNAVKDIILNNSLRESGIL
jgi:guanine nucleotide-binding protein subunit alpha